MYKTVEDFLEVHFRAKKYYWIVFHRCVLVKCIWQERDGRNGRMGGGWTWKAGCMFSPGIFVLEFFVISIRITKIK
jgi:hypothetical protein